MSQSIRAPGGIAIRAVAAASLFASKPKNDGAEKPAAKGPQRTGSAPTLKVNAGLKPQPKR